MDVTNREGAVVQLLKRARLKGRSAMDEVVLVDIASENVLTLICQ